MKREEVLSTLIRESNSYHRFGVKSLALFGSVARDEARAESDVDILVEFESIPTFAQYMDLKFFLEDLLGKKVDLVQKKMLHPTMLLTVEREVVPVVA